MNSNLRFLSISVISKLLQYYLCPVVVIEHREGIQSYRKFLTNMKTGKASEI